MAPGYINNEYAFTIDIDLDLNLLKKIIFKDLYIKEEGMASHHRYADRHEYLKNLRQRYPFLSDVYNIYVTHQSIPTPIHVDKNRSCALNIPIMNTDRSSTVFYKADTSGYEDIPERVYYLIKSEPTEVFRFIIDRPTLINTKVPHGVSGTGDKRRVIMSWSIFPEYSFEDIKKLMSVG